jgi:hypothetical protein
VTNRLSTLTLDGSNPDDDSPESYFPITERLLVEFLEPWVFRGSMPERQESVSAKPRRAKARFSALLNPLRVAQRALRAFREQSLCDTRQSSDRTFIEDAQRPNC